MIRKEAQRNRNTDAVLDTRSVSNRPQLTFGSLEDLIHEAERLSQTDVRTLGNWSLGQILDHLATWMEFSIDGVPARMPAAVRLIVRPLRRWFIRRPMPAGFRWSANADPRLVPQRPVSEEEGLERLRGAVALLRATPRRAPSPLFGELSADEWEQFHLRHAELHLSFVVPCED